jgi:hypothetical protein
LRNFQRLTGVAIRKFLTTQIESHIKLFFINDLATEIVWALFCFSILNGRCRLATTSSCLGRSGSPDVGCVYFLLWMVSSRLSKGVRSIATTAGEIAEVSCGEKKKVIQRMRRGGNAQVIRATVPLSKIARIWVTTALDYTWLCRVFDAISSRKPCCLLSQSIFCCA